MAPYEIAFRTNEQVGYKIINHFIDFMFFFDILVGFRTTYINPNNNNEVISSKKIAINYIKGRFSIDLLATIPFDAFLVDAS